jgi:hypothetical protein
MMLMTVFFLAERNPNSEQKTKPCPLVIVLGVPWLLEW